MIPSPTIAVLPCSFSRRITLSFPSGSTPAITSSTPACLPIAFAVRSLSPVSITTRMPIFCSSRMARGLSSLMTSATAMIPRNLSPFAKYRGVFPSPARESASSTVLSDKYVTFLIKDSFPPDSTAPFRTAVSPFPGSARNSVTSSAASPSASAFCKTAFARGCSLFRSSI